VSAEHADVLYLIRIACRTTAEWAAHHSTFPRIVRDRPKSTPDDWSALGQAWRGFVRLSGTDSLATALEALETSERPCLIVDTVGGATLVTSDDLTRWLLPSRNLGMADLEGPLSDLVPLATAQVRLPRKATCDDFLSRMAAANANATGWRPRAAIISETGKPDEAPIAVIDLTDLPPRR